MTTDLNDNYLKVDPTSEQITNVTKLDEEASGKFIVLHSEAFVPTRGA